MSSDNHLAAFAREHARTTFHAAVLADAHDHAARQMASGVHTPEKAPLFEGMQHGELRPEAVQKVGAMIASAPPGMRGQAIAKAHDELSRWIQQHGRIVGPDGRVQIARNPEQAHSLAAGIINAEIGRHEKAAEDERKAQQEAAADAEKAQAAAQKEAQKRADKQQKEREGAGEPTIEQRAKTLLDAYPERDPVAVLQRNLGIGESQARMLADHVRQNAAIDAAPKVGGKGHDAIEEPKATISKQIEALVKGTIKAVMLPVGSKYTPKVPEGIRVVEVRGDAPGAGKWLYRADKLNAATIKEAARNGTHGALLGHVSTKEEVKASGNPVIVQARHPDGTVIQDSAVDGDKPGAVHAQAANLHERHPEAHIQAVAPHEALNERIAATSNEGEKQEVSQPAGNRKDIFDQVQPYSYGNTQAAIAHGSQAHGAIVAMQGKVREEHLAGKGKDVDEPHVTVRYGIQGGDVSGIRKYLGSQPPFEAKLGKTGVFPPSKNSDGAAVVMAPVESPDLYRMNAEIGKHGKFKESDFAEYKPHATVAYVHPDHAEKYRGMNDGEGKTFRVDSIDISHRDGSKETVSLKGEKSATENQGHPAGEGERATEPAKPAEAARSGPATPEVAKGARVKFTDRTGAERVGKVLYTDGRIARVKCDDKKSYSVAIGRLQPDSGGAGFNEAALADAQRAASASSTGSETQ